MALSECDRSWQTNQQSTPPTKLDNRWRGQVEAMAGRQAGKVSEYGRGYQWRGKAGKGRHWVVLTGVDALVRSHSEKLQASTEIIKRGEKSRQWSRYQWRGIVEAMAGRQ